jgi:hypothetical protein
MRDLEIAKAVQLLDLMLEFFADDVHWTRGWYDDENGEAWHSPDRSRSPTRHGGCR